MQSLLVIFNGIKFPYHLMEYSLEQAKKRAVSLHALFLKGKEDPADGYGFPSDLGQTDKLTSAEDARNDDNKIIRHCIKMAEDMAATENVSFTSEVKTDSRLAEILAIVKNFDLIYMDAGYDDDTPSMLTSNHFTSKHLIEQASSAVELISEDSGKNVVD